MKLSDTEVQHVPRALEAYLVRARPPFAIRDQVDVAYRIEGQSVLLFEVRPQWHGQPGEMTELPIAKATYVRTHKHWSVFWQRADLKWHRYEPRPQVNSVDEFLTLVEHDEYSCFSG